MVWALLVLLGLLLGFGAVLWNCWRKVFWVKRSAAEDPFALRGQQYEPWKEQIRGLIEQAMQVPFEEVTVRSADGLELYGRYYEITPGLPLQILVHGYRSNALRDFCGGLFLARECGCNVLLVDQRGHGRSQGRDTSFGIREREDCLCWVNWANARFGTGIPVFLVGISMGAASVLMASELALPENVRGIIADCGYSSPEKIIRKVLADKGMQPWLYPLIRLSGRVFGGFDVASASAERALTRCRVPVLLIHGEEDRLVPCQMSRENYDACAGEKTLLTVPGAGHAMCLLTDPKAYRDAVKKFLDQNLYFTFDLHA